MTTLLLAIILTVLPYGSFRRVGFDVSVNMVEAVAQDADGMMWFGTTSGLFCYDGYSTRQLGEAGRTYSIEPYGDAVLALGTENGLVLLDGRDNSFTYPEGSPGGVRSVVCDADSLWVGSFDGLYSFKNGVFTPHPGTGNSIIYSLLDDGNNLYIGTYDGLKVYSKGDGLFRDIPVPSPGERVNTFVNALIGKDGNILFGTEDGLFRYAPLRDNVAEIPVCRNSVKSFCEDGGGNLLIGTDNGLYILTEDGDILHIRHEATRNDSLGNDIIWSIMKDREGNIWLGTDGEVSLALNPLPFIPVSEITNTTEGNRFGSILRDRRGRLWLGGTDGLIRTGGGETLWYKVDNSRHPISHNRIRKVYEDREGDLWICTDGSIHILRGEDWRKLNLEDSSHTRNANWAYDILEDDRGRMWVATSLGGVLIKDKEALLGGSHIADSVITLEGGRGGLYAYKLARDGKGHIWCLFYEDGLRNLGGEAPSTGGEIPMYLCSDSQGRIWTALRGRLMRDDGKEFPLGTQADVLSLGEVGGKIWVATADGTFAIDRESGEKTRIYTGGKTIYSIFDDGDEVILGTADGIFMAPAGDMEIRDIPRKTTLTGIYTGGVWHSTIDGKNVRRASGMVFPNSTASLGLSFSDFSFGRERSRILWCQKGSKEGWQALPEGSNTVTFTKPAPGRYTIMAGVPDSAGNPSGVTEVHFRIRQPWYLRWWAFLLYALGAAIPVVGIMLFRKMRGRLENEKEDIKKDLEIARKKNIPTLENTPGSPDEKFMALVNGLIQEHIDDNSFGVAALSEKSGLGDKMVYRKVKQLTGMTPVEYIRLLRLRHAAALLRENKYTVSEVMYMSGFTNASYFSKCFQAEFGTTPKNFS